MAEFEIEIECKTKTWTIFWDVEAETAKKAAETALEEICQDHIEVDQNHIILSVVKINGVPNLDINL